LAQLSLAREFTAPLAPARELSQAKTLSLATVALGLLIAWLPLQTPLAIVAFQYGHAERVAWAMLLAKDVFTALLILYFFARYWRKVHFYWFDWAAVAYVALLGVYSVVPWLLGSHIGVASVVASIRELGVPVELYALGRLALAAGADIRLLIRWFLVVSALAAAFTVGVWALLPASFWASTLDLVGFVRVVQGIPNALTIWDISLVAHFGGGASTIYSRAVGPFTQPVGTAHYFVLPLILCVAFGFESLNAGRRRDFLIAGFLALLVGAAVVTPISRGSWIAAGLAFLLCALIYRHSAIVLVVFLVAGAVLLAVPASRNSIVTSLTGTDTSSAGHAQALDTGLKTYLDHPLGWGVGQSGQFGQVLSGGDSAGAGIGENMYLELLVSVGPLGFFAFVAWMGGLLWSLGNSLRRGPPLGWIVVGSVAALVGYYVSALFASPLMRFTTSASVWLVVGLCVGLVLASERSTEGPDALAEGATAPATSAG
jgi:hypothetical protein